MPDGIINEVEMDNQLRASIKNINSNTVPLHMRARPEKAFFET